MRPIPLCLAVILALSAPHSGQQLAGRALGPTGEPVAGALVIVLGVHASSSTATGDDGVFTVPDVSQARKVVVHRADLGWITADLPSLRAQVRDPWVLTLAESPLRRIRIRRQDGTPAAEATVRPLAVGAMPLEGLALAAEVRADEHGEASLRVPEGEVVMIDPAEGPGLQVRFGAEPELRVDLLPHFPVRGRFEALDDTPAGGLTLVLTGRFPEGAGVAPGLLKATSSSDGSFELACPRGEFYASVLTPPGCDFAPMPFDLMRDPAPVEAGVELRVPLIRSPQAFAAAGMGYLCTADPREPGVVVVGGVGHPFTCGNDGMEPIAFQGRVLGSDGKPVKAWIRASAGGHLCGDVLSREDGSFSLIGRGFGSTVTLRAETRSEATQTRVSASRTSVVLRLSPKELLPVRARLVDRKGQEVAGARVRVVECLQQLPNGQATLDGLESLVGLSDADGLFTSVPAGVMGDRVELMIEGDGLPSQTHWTCIGPPTVPAATIALEEAMDDSPITWTDVREIAFRLAQAHEGVDPLTVRFTDLHAWVTALPGFKGEPKGSSEKILEAIQMAWLDELD